MRSRRIATKIIAIFCAMALIGLLYAFSQWNASKQQFQHLQAEAAARQRAVTSPASVTTAAKSLNAQQTLASGGNNVKTIVYDRYGFDPSMDTVAPDSTMTLQNKSSAPVNVEAVAFTGAPVAASPLNIGTIGPGQSATFTIGAKSVWQYQANNNPAVRAIVGSN